MTRGWAQKKAAWKTAVATFISINLKPRKFRYFQLPPPKRGTNFPTFSTQGVYLFSSHGQGLYPWNPATFGRKLRWMWVAKRWPSSIDSGRTCTLILFFGNGNGGLMKMVGNSQEAPLCFYVFDPYLYICAVVCFRALLVYLASRFQGFMLTKYVFAVARGACQNMPFFCCNSLEVRVSLAGYKQEKWRLGSVGIPRWKTYDPGGDEPASGEEFLIPIQTKRHPWFIHRHLIF